MKCSAVRSKRGFTLTELLVTIAIIGVLMSLAVVGVVNISRNLKMAELDSIAREIFLTSQNTLTARKAAGTAQTKGAQENGSDQYWLFDEDVSYLLPEGAIEAEICAGNIAIMYNASSCIVLEVYYAERGTELVATDLMSGKYSNSFGGAGERREAKIGFYNGSDIENVEAVQLFAPQIEITNGETLDVAIKVPDATRYASWGVKLNVKLEGLTSGEIIDLSNISYNTATGAAESIILDSLSTSAEQRFFKLCQALLPGEDIKITASLDADSKNGVTYLSSKTAKTTNSLFEGVSGSTVYIANARHLQNLESSYSGCVLEKVSVLQVEAISWPRDMLFTSVTVDGSSNISSFDGASLGIYNLYGTGGLFSAVSGGAVLENIHIINANISGSGNIGMLANSTNGAEISGCMAYLFCDNYSDYSAFSLNGGVVGGLIGEAVNTVVTDSAAAVYSASGTTVGGFIGSAENTRVSNSYASAENLYGSSGTGGFFGASDSSSSSAYCYAVGNISSSKGTRCGFACGNAVVSKSYCAVTYYTNAASTEELEPTFGFSAAANSSCAYWMSCESDRTESAKALSYAQLCNWDFGSSDSPAAGSYPYREMDDAVYPFCGVPRKLSNATLPHYGSWPEDRTDYIALRDADRNVCYFALLPQNSTGAIYAMPCENGERIYSRLDSVEVPYEATEKGILESAELGYYNPANGTTAIIIESGAQTGVTYIDVESNGYKLRVIVVVYDVTVKLSVDGETYVATNKTESGLAKMTGTSSKVITRGKVDSVEPELNEIENRIAKIASQSVAIPLSANAEHFASWNMLCGGDPAVTANGEPDKGVYYFAPVNDEYFFNALTDGDEDDSTLTVTGAASGTGTVSARWAMDTSVEATYHIRVNGARAFIEKIEETNSSGAVINSKKNYPYRLDLIAEPGQTVYLRFTPRIFNSSSEKQKTEYIWNVYRIEGNDAVAPNLTQENTDNSTGVYSFTLSDTESYATYLVVLEYKETLDDGTVIGRSLDYTTFTIYRRALASDEPVYLNIIQTNGWMTGNVPQYSGNSLWLEQIDGNGYDDVNTATLQAWVAGAENTKTIWQYSTDGGESWIDVTGHLGSQPVYDSDGKLRATVQWNNDDQLYGEFQTGGSITVTGLDADVYGSESFEFYLRSSAAEATINGEYTTASKIITVEVLPKMELMVKSKVQIYLALLGWEGYTFFCNRDDGIYDYQWNVKEALEYGVNYCKVKAQDGRQYVEVRYGPHTDTGSLTYVGIVEDSPEHYTVNWDYSVNSEYHILVEKGSVKNVEFSWNRMRPFNAKIGKHPMISNEWLDIAENTLAENTTNYASEGSYSYTVRGKEFTNDSPVEANWTIYRNSNSLLNNTSLTAYFHVVGMEVKGADGVTIGSSGVVLRDLGSTAALKADFSFPTRLMQSVSVTWNVDNPDLVGFKDGVNTGGSVTLVAKKYSSQEYSATVTAVCTITDINDKTFTYTDNIVVNVSPSADAEWTLEPCTSADAGALAEFWPEDGITSRTHFAFVQKDAAENCYALLADEALGIDVMYLKLTGVLSGGISANIEEYFWSIANDWLYLNAETYLSEDKTTLYVRVAVNEATEELSTYTFGVHIGNTFESVQIQLCETPKIKMFSNGIDVTNESVAITTADDVFPVTLSAAIEPMICAADAPDTPLYDISWSLVAAVGYDATEYLRMTRNGDSVEVRLVQEGKIPDFRVVVAAQNSLGGEAGVGYSIVFLPEET